MFSRLTMLGWPFSYCKKITLDYIMRLLSGRCAGRRLRSEMHRTLSSMPPPALFAYPLPSIPRRRLLCRVFAELRIFSECGVIIPLPYSLTIYLFLLIKSNQSLFLLSIFIYILYH